MVLPHPYGTLNSPNIVGHKKILEPTLILNMEINVGHKNSQLVVNL